MRIIYVVLALFLLAFGVAGGGVEWAIAALGALAGVIAARRGKQLTWSRVAVAGAIGGALLSGGVAALGGGDGVAALGFGLGAGLMAGIVLGLVFIAGRIDDSAEKTVSEPTAEE